MKAFSARFAYIGVALAMAQPVFAQDAAVAGASPPPPGDERDIVVTSDPLLPTALVGTLVGSLTDVPRPTVEALVESLHHDMVARDDDFEQLLLPAGHRLVPLDESPPGSTASSSMALPGGSSPMPSSPMFRLRRRGTGRPQRMPIRRRSAGDSDVRCAGRSSLHMPRHRSRKRARRPCRRNL